MNSLPKSCIFQEWAESESTTGMKAISKSRQKLTDMVFLDRMLPNLAGYLLLRT
jgi:DNA-binding response OmpR family regulator